MLLVEIQFSWQLDYKYIHSLKVLRGEKDPQMKGLQNIHLTFDIQSFSLTKSSSKACFSNKNQLPTTTLVYLHIHGFLTFNISLHTKSEPKLSP